MLVLFFIVPHASRRVNPLKIAWLRLTRFLCFCDFSLFIVNL